MDLFAKEKHCVRPFLPHLSLSLSSSACSTTQEKEDETLGLLKDRNEHENNPFSIPFCVICQWNEEGDL